MNKVSLFDYDLPVELIAQHPVEPRDASRMLVLDRTAGAVEHRTFRHLPSFLRTDDLLVLNDTRVIPARLSGRRETGASVEVLLLNRMRVGIWRCLVNPGRKVRPGDRIVFGPGLTGEVEERLEEGARSIRFIHEGSFESVLEQLGSAPLPPYIKRSKPDPADRRRYQTIYAEHPGAVAAPTAGLHFSEKILKEIEDRGIRIVCLTLHVGLGTFRPVKVENVEEHRMDSEWFEIGSEAADHINLTKEKGGRIVAVGTTVVRSLESAWDDSTGSLTAGSGLTDLFITPGFRFSVVDLLLTNFHLPRSTLLMLVSAFAGREQILAAYKEAINEKYRFYSYGDCMLIL